LLPDLINAHTSALSGAGVCLAALHSRTEREPMDLILIILILLLLFGGGFGYRRYGHRGGLGIGGILLLILIIYLIFRHGRI